MRIDLKRLCILTILFGSFLGLNLAPEKDISLPHEDADENEIFCTLDYGWPYTIYTEFKEGPIAYSTIWKTKNIFKNCTIMFLLSLAAFCAVILFEKQQMQEQETKRKS